MEKLEASSCLDARKLVQTRGCQQEEGGKMLNNNYFTVNIGNFTILTLDISHWLPVAKIIE